MRSLDEIIVHVGHGKTGSSAIQAYLAQARLHLLDYGYCYPAVPNESRALSGKITSGNGVHLLDESYQYEIPEGATKVVFSSESLFPLLSKVKALQRVQAMHDGKLRIFLYTRDLFSMAYSSWGQLVKRGHKGGTLPFNDWVRSQFGAHLKTIETYIASCEHAGIGLNIRNYSRHQEDLILDFLAAVVDSVTAEHLVHSVLPSSVRVNRSLTLAEYEIQRLFNIFSNQPTGGFVSDLLVDNLPWVDAEKPQLERSTYEFCLNKFAPLVSDINTKIDAEEVVKIESYDTLEERCTSENEVLYSITREQLEVLVEGVATKLNGTLSSQDGLDLYHIARRAERSKLDASEVLFLLKLAQRGRPEGPVIASAIAERERSKN